MKNVLIALVLSLTALSACQQKSPEEENASLKKIEAVDFSHVKINDSFWSTILVAYRTLRMLPRNKASTLVSTSTTLMYIRHWKALPILW